MKKLFYFILIAGLTLASAACQKVDEKNPANSSDALTVTASIVNFDGTKVSYAFSDPTNAKSAIKPSWEIGDEIFGFDEDGDTFTFSVSSVDSETGKATFNTTDASNLNGTLYAVYYPGKSIANFSDKELAVDLSSQSGSLDGNTPVIMCATGSINDNAVNFNFVNQTAIVGIYKMQVYNSNVPVAANQAVTDVTLKGAIVNGTIKVKDGVLTLEAGTTTADLTADVDFETETDGYVNVDPDAIAPYFAVIPATDASLTIEAKCDGNTCSTDAAITGALAAGKYYYLGKKIYGGTVAATVATLTVGGETTEFASVEAAIAAANEANQACTIKLTASSTVGAQAIVSNTNGVTLDLNDNVLTFDATNRVYVGANASLTIIDSGNNKTGTINQNANTTTNTIYMANKNSNLIIKGGHIAGLENQTSATIYIKAGKLTMNGGKVTSYKNAIGIEDNGVLTVTDGEIEALGTSNSSAIYLGSGATTIDISGGYIHSQKATINITNSSQHQLNLSGDCTVASASSNALYSISTSTEPVSTVTVNGGKYSCPGLAVFSTGTPDSGTVSTQYIINSCIFNGTVASKRLDKFHKSVDNDDPATRTDYPEKIVEYIPVTLQIGSGDPLPYATVEEAVTEANNNSSSDCLITLYDNLTVTTTTEVTNGTGVTLDLNDNTLTFSGTNRIRPTTGGKLIIKDSGTNGTITNTNGNNQLLFYNAGELVLESGTLKPAEISGTSSSRSVVFVQDAIFTMEGGTITDGGKNMRALTIGGSKTTTVNIRRGAISGGNDTTTNRAFGAIYINNQYATCTIDGEDVAVTSPNIGVSTNNAVVPIVSVNSGNLVLKKGTIGSATNPTENIGNITAVRVTDGTFTMEGGYLYARRHAIIFSGTGTATISGGRLATTVTGWSLVRFQDGSTNQLTINGGGFTVAGSTGKIFAGKTTGATVPSKATVSINPVCYFDKSPYINGITSSNVTGMLSQGSYTYDGKSYSYKVE